MALGVGNIVALICIVISIIFAIVAHQATNALWWALLATRGKAAAGIRANIAAMRLAATLATRASSASMFST